jgi:hypothetical protein
MHYNPLMNTKTSIVVVIVLILVAACVIYLHSSHQQGYSVPITAVATTSSQTATTSTSSMTLETQGGPVSITNQDAGPVITYATYSLKDPNQLPITQYPKAYGVELDFVATAGPLPSKLCLKVAADVPIKAFSIPGHSTDASTTIATTTRAGAYEGMTCFSGGITAEEDTTVYFDAKPSQINSLLSTSDVL